MNTDAIESMVRDVLSRMNSLQGDAPAAASAAGGTSRSAKVSDYPLANKHPEWVKTATNKTLDDFTLENVLSNKVTAQDMRLPRKPCAYRRLSPKMRAATGWR